MIIKYATEKSIKAIAAVDAKFFPPAEAVTKKDFVKILLERVDHYGNHFLLMYDEEKLIVFVDGFVIYEPDLTDYIYENIAQS